MGLHGTLAFGARLTPALFRNIGAGLVTLALITTATGPALAQASFEGLGYLSGETFSSQANAVSADGSVVVGISNNGTYNEAFRWTVGGGMVGLGELSGGNFYSEAYGVSADGSVVVGQSSSDVSGEAFRWTEAEDMVGLGDLPGGSFNSLGLGVSADGTVVVGLSRSALGPEAFRWEDGVMDGLGDLPGGSYLSQALGITPDGSVVVGSSRSDKGSEAFRWTVDGGIDPLGDDLPGGIVSSFANAVSADGSVVVGSSGSASGPEAFRWTLAGGMVGLGEFPDGEFTSSAFGVSADGSVVVGMGNSASGQEAFIWDSTRAMRNLKDVLETDFGLDLTGWTLKRATGISADGLAIVGHGTNPSGDQEAWIARLPHTQPCSANCPPVTPVAEVDLDAEGNPVIDPPPEISITFDEITYGGDTSVLITKAGPPPPEGFKLGNPPVYFDMETTATFIGSIDICINYSSIDFGAENTLALAHRDGTQWVNITTSLDTDANIICGTTSSLSPFALVESDDPVELLAGLATLIAELNAKKGIINSFDAKYDSVVKAYGDANTNNDVAAVNALQALINASEAQSGGQLDPAQADELIASARVIIAVLTGEFI